MKRRTFYHLSLSLPYIVLIISGALTYFANGFDLFASSDPPGVLMGSIFFFSIAAIIWGPLYTWMVIAMLFWGRGKSVDAIRRLYILSPLLLACSMGVPALLIGMPDSGLFLLWGFLYLNHLDFVMPALFENYYYYEQSMTISLAWAFMAAICVVFGYAFVGIALLLERTIEKRNLFKSEEVTNSL